MNLVVKEPAGRDLPCNTKKYKNLFSQAGCYMCVTVKL